ncbi:MAG: signal recognition particle-docking protein FtsY [Anaerolineaceae bacterium]|jgi:fused signal recognition particle receptor
MTDFVSKWKNGLERTRKTTFGRISTFFGATQINSQAWEQLEALLIQADMGIEVTESILVSLRKIVAERGFIRLDELQQSVHDELFNRLEPAPNFDLDAFHPTVILLVGVNGSGKTTTAAKLGQQFALQGKKVLLAAADTYRAAAVEQLQVWAEKLDLSIITGQPDADPGAVAYDAVQAALARKMDVLLVDTAGRLHTRYNLMEELKKVHRVVGKAMPTAPHATWLVLDATTGQNALLQAKAFKEAVHVNGIILAKLDSSARGGMAFAIQSELGLPILYVGLGEKPEDLQVFDREAFVESILS